MYLQILISIILAILAYILGRFRDDRKQIFNKKLEVYSSIVCEINSFDFMRSDDHLGITSRLIKLFSPARLIGSNEVVDQLREYFSLITEYFAISSLNEKNNKLNELTTCAMELEQLMREDLGRTRHLSKLSVLVHSNKHKIITPK